MADLLLEAHGLRKTFTSGRGAQRRVVHAVADVDLAIEPGQTHGLVGGSGSGKSTVARLLLRLVEPDAGTATFRGVDLFALDGAELRRMRRHIQLVYQDPFSALDPRFRVRDIVSEPWDIHGLHDRAERRRRADELLARVGIDPALGDLRPASFSGGQQQRIGIARALALEPDLIVCDEPVSSLDASVQGQILDLLMELQRDLGIAYLFISHDLAVVRHMSHVVSVMQEGRIVESGTREGVFGAPRHPYTLALLEAVDLAGGSAGAGLAASSASDARVDGDDGQVRQQVDQGHEQPGDDADAHDEGRVEAGQADGQVGAQARHREGRLDDGDAGEEPGHVERQDREQR
jgi:ABC-type glutathione transport system ATPase component